MRIDNKKLGALLVALLVCVAAVAMVLDPGTWVPQKGPKDYGLVITEICTRNETIVPDNSGRYSDYIEIYNAGEPLNLAGFTLTDGKVRSPAFGDFYIGTGEYRVIFLGRELMGFGLAGSGGDSLQLLDPEGNIVIQVNTAAMLRDQVMRYEGGIYVTSDSPSPGFSNDRKGVAAFREGWEAENPEIIISEVLLGNTASLPDERGVYSDVIELRNVSEERVSLGGYCLSDTAAQRFTFRLPDVILEAGEYVLVYCDGGNYVAASGQIHANFRLSHGETLWLTNREGGYIQAGAEYAGENVSRALNDQGLWEDQAVSLGFDNTEEGAERFAQSRIREDSPLVISEVLLSQAGVPYQGEIRDVVEIRNRSTETVSTLGWHLSDGADPYDCPLPEMELAPGECLVVVCGADRTGFSLAEGETVYLTGPDYRIAPPVKCLAQPGQSMGLQPGGGEMAYGFMEVTLGYGNEAENTLLFQQGQMPQGLRISEVMSANRSYLRGAYGTTCDWIELYNASAEAVELSQYRLSDDAGNPGKYPLPELTLDPGEYCVILLSEDPTNLPRGYAVVNFAISSEGEQLYLSLEGQIQDYVMVPRLEVDLSYGRSGKDGNYGPLSKVTPGYENSGHGGISATPVAVTPQGVYDGVEYVDVVLSGPGELYYTTNCTAPGRNAKRYTGPIRLTRTTVIRVVCREEGKKQSQVLDLTYVINENDQLDVVCLVLEPEDLWNKYRGIYVEGPNAAPEEPHYGANYWKDWEKSASISLFEDQGEGFSARCGIKIFGGYTRKLGKKSLAVFFRGIYGQGELEYPLFGEGSLDTYESFVLRSSGQDHLSAKMRDVVITSLASEHLGLPVQRYRPVVVYLNGSYWGLHYIREKVNENYVAGNFNVPAETVTLAEWAGTYCTEYQELLKYARNHDLAEQEHYDYVCSQIDVDNYIDYMVAQIWLGNIDNGNVKYFKTPEGKWTWILFDTDLSMLDVRFNSVKDHLNWNIAGGRDFTSKTLALELMAHPEFRDKFLKRLAWQMNHVWTEENVCAKVDEIEALIETDVVKDCQRWQHSYNQWRKNVDALRSFARNRNKYLVGYIQSYFALSDEEMAEYGFQK